MKKLSIWSLIVFSIISLVLIGGVKQFGPREAIAKTTLQAASGGLGGSWYGQMARLADIIMEEEPDIIIKTVPGAGLANLVRTNEGEADIAWAFPNFAKDAFEGTGEFKTPNPNIRGIATGFTLHPFQFLVTKDSGINSVREIKEKKTPIKLVIGRAGSGDEVAARMILDYYGMTYKDIESWGGKVMMLEYGDQVKKIKDRQANGYVNIMPIPAAVVQEIILSRPLKMLSYEPKMVQIFREKYSFSSQKITKDMYDGKVVDEEFSAPAADLTLIVNKDVSEDVVYNMTKAICENAEKVHKIGPTFVNFAPAVAWDNLGLPLHPGAEKYYREKGYMK